MKHVKSFNDLLKESYGENAQITYQQIKDTPGYTDLIKSGFIDITTPSIQKNGNLRFKHPVSDLEYSIFSNGYIRYQNSNPNWIGGKSAQSVYASPIGERTVDRIYGKPIKNIQDFDLKFGYLKRVLIKTILKSLDIPPKSADSIETLSELLNKEIEKNASLIKNPGIKSLIDLGIFNPNEYTKLMTLSSEFGIF